MINSMTGYGESQCEINGVSYTVEIKTVNNRYFKSSIRLPETAAFLEEDIEKLLRKNFSRGTVTYALRPKDVSSNTLFDINEKALQGYMEKLGKVVSSAGIKCPIDIGALLTLPGVVQPMLPDEETAEQVKKAVLSITQEAIDKVKQMRSAEGAALAADLESHCETIKQDLERIRSGSETILQEYHRKLKKRVDGLLAEAKLKLDEEVLAREVAVFAERSDISEELARLESHLEQFAETRRADGQAGRRLDFISQEMLREANTIASKSCDSEIIHWVVDMKCWIERIKEQVQNVE